MLRLGCRYGFDSLYADAKSRLTYEFPTDFTQLEAVAHKFTFIESRDGLRPIFDILNLARELGFISILPFALYCCVRRVLG